MNPSGQSRSEIIQAWVVLAVMLWLLWWVGSAIYHSHIFWLKMAALFVVGCMLLMGAFIAWLAISQWLDKRRCAREGRPWNP